MAYSFDEFNIITKIINSELFFLILRGKYIKIEAAKTRRARGAGFPRGAGAS